MITYTHTLGGQSVTINIPERRADLSAFDEFLSLGDPVLGFDTETTGLDIYAPRFRLRLAQFGNRDQAFVIDALKFPDVIRRVLRSGRKFVAHNAPYDLKVVDQTLGVRLEELADNVFDTRIFAHLLDPRDKAVGGAGLRLKELATIYVADDAPDTEDGLTKEFNRLGFTKETGWAGIPIDNELYNRYAGLDPILAFRLFYEIGPLVADLGLSGLSKFEHHFQILLAIMARKGMKLDVAYINSLRLSLSDEAAHYEAVAAQYGVDNVNSTAQVTTGLLSLGEVLTERTKTGFKTDKAVMSVLADLDREWERIGAREPNPLADAVMRAKRAGKWQTAYVDAFLALRDTDDRLHASIGALQARTARMSVSAPPLQQLPSGDWRIRRAIVADPGHKMISADYDQVEFRVLAALADVKEMKRAIVEGRDLHDFTAQLVYGDSFTKFHRKLMKGVGFGKVYGGGEETLSRQTGAPIDAVHNAVVEYDRVYPEIKRYGRKLQRRADFGKREVVTPSGRHLPLDKDRVYSATNYMVQSTARDVMAQAIVDMFDSGLGDYLLLPVHDEILAQAPDNEADEIAAEIGRIMSGTFYGVPLTATGDVTGRSWGSAYKIPPELDYAA